MEERKIVNFKKEEFALRELIKKNLGKGKISRVRIEYTPIGEKVIISTNKPGLVIGRRGEKIEELTKLIKFKFNLENPHLEIDEIKNPDFDAQVIADEIALALERFGPLRFKVIAYRTLQRIIKSGALGAELKISGKLPGARAKSWRFAQGYLKKAGDSSKVVDRAQAIAKTKPGIVGIKVSILPPDAILKDSIIINDNLIKTLKENAQQNYKGIEDEKKRNKRNEKR